MASLSFSDLSIGMAVARAYRFNEERVIVFSSLVEDSAAVHVDNEFAMNLGFRGKIVHGLFVQSILSGMLGDSLPGPRSVINTMSMKMHRPVLIGQMVKYNLEIIALTPAIPAVSLAFQGKVSSELVISGRALCSFPNL